MGTVQVLHHINGGAIQCGFCQTYLGDVRAVASINGMVVFFCKAEPDDKPEDSCYLQYRRRFQ